MLKIYNTLSRTEEEFKPLKNQAVGIYSCGPTVYDYQHIGHLRRYVGDDILIRVLRADGFKIHHVMNITDVGHLTSDSDTGEDKMEKGAKKFGKNVWDLAKMFEQQFKDSCKELNIELPTDLMHATDFIKEQIELIQILEGKGLTYRIDDGVYFDTAKFPAYFKLSRQNPDELRAGARIDMGDKKNVSDFALWKFSPKEEKRQMEWESPWGVGFPGWHIECSAMSMKALGETFDIHTGGIDHINIHHTNEIAQSEAATGKPFVNYWVHHAFLMVEDEKMSKSSGNIYTVQDVVQKGFNPLALRYLYLQTHYRQEMNFTWEALEAAQTALNRLYQIVANLPEATTVSKKYLDNFFAVVNDDLNMPKAVSVVWEMLKSEIADGEKHATILEMDKVLGLSVQDAKGNSENKEKVPPEVSEMLKKREELRSQKKYQEADEIRNKIIEMGYKVEDK